MNNRTPLIAGNWKMYKTTPEAVDTAQRLVELVIPPSVLWSWWPIRLRWTL
jgi:triosephosphate isomerase